MLADAHCGDGRRFVVQADEKLTGFLELESTISRFRPFRVENASMLTNESAIAARENERDHGRLDRTRCGGCVNPALKAIIGHGAIRPN
jgi:hypothetical protein